MRAYEMDAYRRRETAAGPWAAWSQPPEDLAPDTTLFHAGDPVRDLVIIVSGFVWLRGPSRDPGAGPVRGLRGEPSVLGLLAALRDAPHPMTAVTAGVTRIQRCPVPDFERRLRTDPTAPPLTCATIRDEGEKDLQDAMRPFLPSPLQRLDTLLRTLRAPADADVHVLALAPLASRAPLAGLDRDELAALLQVAPVALDALIAGHQRSAGVTDDRVSAAITMINRQLADSSLNLQRVSHQVNVSAWHLSRLFKRATGLGFRRFLNDARLERARVALLTTPLSVKEIAALVGYAQLSDLTRRFTQAYGVSPRKYRSARGRALINPVAHDAHGVTP